MHTTATERIAIAIAAFCLGIAACALLAPRPLHAADGEGWGVHFTGRQPAAIQFRDELAATESPWFTTTVVGFDGTMVACQDEGVQGTIFRPLYNIRQIQSPPPAGGKSGGSSSRGAAPPQ